MNVHEELTQAVDDLLSGDKWLVSSYLAAYVKRTGIDPLEVALIETDLPDGSTAYQFAVLVEDDDGEPVAVRPCPWWHRLLEWTRRRVQWHR